MYSVKMRMDFLNLSAADRGLRIAAGVLMLAAGWGGWVPGVWRVALECFGWIPVLTGLGGWCPFYALFAMRTRPLPGPRPRKLDG